MKRRKIGLVMLLCVGLLCCGAISALATDSPQIYSGEESALWGDQAKLVLNIRNNPGLMGFKLDFSYEDDLLEPVSVSGGEVTENGMLDDNIRFAQPGTFSVIWSSNEDVRTNGTLLTIMFQTKKQNIQSLKIQCEVSQPDTFNSAWEDVVLQCEPLVILPGDGEMGTTIQEKHEPSKGEIISAVEDALKDTGQTDILNPTDEKALVESVNENIKNLTGNENNLTYEELKSGYGEAVRDKYVSDVMKAVDGDKILLSIRQALEQVGADSIETLTENQKEEFVKTAEVKIAQYMAEPQMISSAMDTDMAVDTLNALNDDVEAALDRSTPAPVVDPPNYRWLWISIGCVTVVIVAVGAVIGIKKFNKKKGKDNEKNI